MEILDPDPDLTRASIAKSFGVNVNSLCRLAPATSLDDLHEQWMILREVDSILWWLLFGLSWFTYPEGEVEGLINWSIAERHRRRLCEIL